MKRTNSFNDVASTGIATIDTGDGIQLEVPAAPVPDFAARLAALEYDTGWRLLPEKPAEYTAGRFLVRRTGDQVWLWVDEVRPVDNASATSVTFPSLIQPGMRPPATIYLPVAQRSASYSPGPFRVQPSGTLDIYNNNGTLTVALVSWLTDEAIPVALPGTAVTA